MHFNELGLSADILRAVSEQGYDKPTPIQAQAIPVVLQGHDLMAAAQTGTGKTAGFTLPVLQLLSSRAAPSRTKPRVLVLTPTRELAAQVEDSVRTYGKYLPLKSAVIYGGVSMGPQTKALRDGVDFIVATPGRLLDHVGERNVDLSGIEIFILDEADRMLDMGFIHDIRRVVALLPKKKQTLMFSATFSDEIRTLATSYLHNPQQVEVARRNSTTEMVTQSVFHVDKARKRELLTKLIEDNGWHQVLVFTRTKHGANGLAEKLDKAGIRAAAIHGNKSQNARTRALADFKSLKLHVLVATDIAARGIDIDALPYVVNYELPNVPEDYVHRIGRTGRAGSTGQAVSLVCVDEHKLLHDIERLMKREIEVKSVAGFEVDPSIKAEPIENGRRSQASRAGGPSAQRRPQQRPAQASKPQNPRPQAPKPQGARPQAPQPQGARPQVPGPQGLKPQSPKPQSPMLLASKPQGSKPVGPKPVQNVSGQRGQQQRTQQGARPASDTSGQHRNSERRPGTRSRVS